MAFAGILSKKMRTAQEAQVQYWLAPGAEELHLNSLLGKDITLSHNGETSCLGCKAKKLFSDGFCFRCTQTRADCDICQVRPELCHYAAGTCRDEEFAKTRCMIDHVVYLSLSSHIKVGITRAQNVPSRFHDQGAVRALPILKVKNRLQAGLVEVRLKDLFSDRTSWQKMLKGEVAEADLFLARDQALAAVADLDCQPLDPKELHFTYPILEAPQKVKSINLGKVGTVSGRLMGIKAQYLILSDGVLNVRNLLGHHLEVVCDF